MGPTDLSRFWEGTIEQLKKTEMRASVDESPEQCGREFKTYQVAMDSFQGRRIRSWYSAPNDPPPNGQFPAVLAVPGYGGTKPIPTHLVLNGFIVLTLYPRGQGESIKGWQLEYGTKLTYHLEDKDEFYYRGAYMDCIRGLAFIGSQPEVDPRRLGMWSRSQGGGFTLATASLDSRLKVAVAEEPFLCNYPVSVNITSSPYCELRDYLAQHPEQRSQALETLSYFDCLNLVDRIECPTLVDIGMKDETCPYETIIPAFDRISGPKALHIYPELTHSPSTDFNAHAMSWLRRYLGA